MSAPLLHQKELHGKKLTFKLISWKILLSAIGQTK